LLVFGGFPHSKRQKESHQTSTGALRGAGEMLPLSRAFDITPSIKATCALLGFLNALTLCPYL